MRLNDLPRTKHPLHLRPGAVARSGDQQGGALARVFVDGDGLSYARLSQISLLAHQPDGDLLLSPSQVEHLGHPGQDEG